MVCSKSHACDSNQNTTVGGFVIENTYIYVQYELQHCYLYCRKYVIVCACKAAATPLLVVFYENVIICIIRFAALLIVLLNDIIIVALKIATLLVILRKTHKYLYN